MESKLACMDDDLTIEIIKPDNETTDLIISVSITRTYIFSEQPEESKDNGKPKQLDAHLKEMNAFLL